jgi:Heat induced stress protein YflT domain
MAGKNTIVFGVYRTRAGAEEAVDALTNACFRNTDISVLLPENQGTKDFAHKKDTNAPEGATTGVTSGAVVGGVLGWLAGIGALAIPGLGPFIAAGPIMGALAPCSDPRPLSQSQFRQVRSQRSPSAWQGRNRAPLRGRARPQ